MFEIKEFETQFDLYRGPEFIGRFPTREDADKAKTIAESNTKVPTGTWVDDGKGLEYPEGTDNYHSGAEKPLTFEQRFDAVLLWLRDKHGFHLPKHLAPKE